MLISLHPTQSSTKVLYFLVFVSTKKCNVFVCSNYESKSRLCIKNTICTVYTHKTYYMAFTCLRSSTKT